MQSDGLILMLAMGCEARLPDEIWRDMKQARYEDFLQRKRQLGGDYGFKHLWMPDFLFDFQKYLVDWALIGGKRAVFSDCGTGKGIMALVWAQNVRRHTNKPVLIVTPIAVGQQLAEESARFDIDAEVSRDGKPKPGITITNYERLHLFNRDDYAGVVCDESSAIKDAKGKTRDEVTEFLRMIPYRLLCTATAAPNDYIELGTSSEALGELGYTDMMNRFFKNDENNSGTGRVYGKARQWRFKGHAEQPFWEWMATWARALRKPSDYGFRDDAFILPPLVENQHIVKARTIAPGFLFEMPAKGLDEQRDEQRRTLQERCEKAAELAKGKDPVAIWCNLNPEGDLLAEMCPDLVQVSGSDSIERKEEVIAAFGKGQVKGLITKAKIAGHGLNWQHCNRTILFPSHSYEQYYQLVRRFYRFGQKRRVTVDVITTESGHDVLLNLQRKATQADRMFAALVEHMNEACKLTKTENNVNPEVPSWLLNR